MAIGAGVAKVCVAIALMSGVSCDATRDGGGRGEPISVSASAVHIVGTSESIATVEDLDLLPDGTMLALNSIDPLFIAFEPGGGVRTWGRTGGGPDEFGSASGFVAGGIDGQAWVFDERRHALRRVSGADSMRSEIMLPTDRIPRGSIAPGIRLILSNIVRTARLGDEVLLPRSSNRPEQGVYSYWLSMYTADVIALDPRTDSVRTVIALGDLFDDPASHFDLTDAFLPFPLWNRLWAVCGDAIRVYDRVRNEVRGFTRDGVEMEPVALPPPARADFTREEVAGVLFVAAAVEAAGRVTPGGHFGLAREDSVRIMDQLTSRMTAPVERIANLLPRYTDLRCDDAGTVWMQPFDITSGLGGGRAWLRIAPDGTTRELRLPDRFDAFRFTRERVRGVQRSDLDVASIAWIALPEL